MCNLALNDFFSETERKKIKTSDLEQRLYDFEAEKLSTLHKLGTIDLINFAKMIHPLNEVFLFY